MAGSLLPANGLGALHPEGTCCATLTTPFAGAPLR